MKVMKGTFNHSNPGYDYMQGRECVAIFLPNGRVSYQVMPNPEMEEYMNGWHSNPGDPLCLANPVELFEEQPLPPKADEPAVQGLQSIFGQEVKHLSVEFK